MSRYNRPGWFREYFRHSLAARGISTSKFRRSYAGMLDPREKELLFKDLQAGTLDADVLSDPGRFDLRKALRYGDTSEGVYKLIALSDKLRNKDDWLLAIKTNPELIDFLPPEFNKLEFKDAWIEGIKGKPNYYEKYISAYGFSPDDPVIKELLASPKGIEFADKMKSDLYRLDSDAWQNIVKSNPAMAVYSPYASFEDKSKAISMNAYLIKKISSKNTTGDEYKDLVTLAVRQDNNLLSYRDYGDLLGSDVWMELIDKNPSAASYYVGRDPSVLNKIIEKNPGKIFDYPDAPKELWERALSAPGIDAPPSKIPRDYQDAYIASLERGLDPEAFSLKNQNLVKIHNQDLFNLAYFVKMNGGKMTKQQIEAVAAQLKMKGNPQNWRPLTNKQAIVDFLNSQHGNVTVSDIVRFDSQHPEYYADQEVVPLIGTMKQSGVTSAEVRKVLPEFLDPFGERKDVSPSYSRYYGEGDRLNPNSNIVFQLNWNARGKAKAVKLANMLRARGVSESEIADAVRRGVGGSHPTSIKGDVTLAMARLYPMKDTLYVEELQSDVEGFRVPTIEFEDAAFRNLQKEVMSKAPSIKKIIFPGFEFKRVAYKNEPNMTFYDRIAEKNKMRQLPVQEKLSFFQNL